MAFDRSVLKQTTTAQEDGLFQTFLSSPQPAVKFTIAFDAEWPLMGGDFNSPLAVALRFSDGDMILWDPWSPDED